MHDALRRVSIVTGSLRFDYQTGRLSWDLVRWSTGAISRVGPFRSFLMICRMIRGLFNNLCNAYQRCWSVQAFKTKSGISTSTAMERHPTSSNDSLSIPWKICSTSMDFNGAHGRSARQVMAKSLGTDWGVSRPSSKQVNIPLVEVTVNRLKVGTKWLFFYEAAYIGGLSMWKLHVGRSQAFDEQRIWRVHPRRRRAVLPYQSAGPIRRWSILWTHAQAVSKVAWPMKFCYTLRNIWDLRLAALKYAFISSSAPNNPTDLSWLCNTQRAADVCNRNPNNTCRQRKTIA